jgi:Domain of Unknown Function (DUF1080)
MKIIILHILCLFALAASGQSKKEKGWQSLFNGKTTEGWHNYGKKDISALWKVENNCLIMSQKGAGDIATDKEYENFEFELEWKISEGGNSGIYYLVNENLEKYTKGWNTGPEMQVLDDDKHPDATKGKDGNHQAGSLYDLIPATNKQLKPVGEWNVAKIIVNKGKVEHWLNGSKVVSYDLDSPEFIAVVKASKFSAHPDFAKFRKGRIVLQDHGDLVWYRNIRIRKL